uniref:Uncharacterized protein n=1 Tax=Anguilla anguilla TaxID=7936 RepID=A0A0E9WGY3_ANGAN
MMSVRAGLGKGSILRSVRVRLILRLKLKLFLPLHVAMSAQDAQVAAVHRQQHHGSREQLVSHVSHPLPRNHGDGSSLTF